MHRACVAHNIIKLEICLELSSVILGLLRNFIIIFILYYCLTVVTPVKLG